ncbi:MAG: hypothetical protein GY765_30345 [bacterium]|nr:hypothetical protein [bacterium]
MVQLYTTAGEFLKEVEVPGAKAAHQNEMCTYYRKSDNSLYILDIETSPEFEQFYKVHRYQIVK